MLEARGYQMYQRKNSWSDPEYKGLNTRWVTPDGQRFEVQFHTPESFHAKHDVTHRAYERLRRPRVDPAERQELMDFQKLVSSCIPIPDRAQEISDFNKDDLMVDKITYYAIIAEDRTVDNPFGLVRRLETR